MGFALELEKYLNLVSFSLAHLHIIAIVHVGNNKRMVVYIMK